MTEPVFDPLDPDHYRDPWARLAEARRMCPVSEPTPDMVFVAAHADVRSAFRDVAHLSNEGNFRIAAKKSDTPVGGEAAGGDRRPSLVALDPPRHTQMRRLLLSAFTTAAVADEEAFIRELTTRLVESVRPDGGADLMEALARPLPAVVISHMLGVPESDWDSFSEWTADITAHLPTTGPPRESRRQFDAYTAALVAERRAAADPPDDLISRLMAAEVEGARLDDVEVAGAVFQLIVAGNDTATRLIANTTYRLLADRALWERVQADRSLVPVAVEESLRYDSPIQWAMRVCRADTEIAGRPVRDGQRVLLGIGSANRDEAVFDDPDRFSLDRDNGDDHLAFGHGIHLCLGAALGRMEGRVALETMLDVLPDMELAPGFEYQMVDAAMVRGPQRVDVVWPT